MVNKLQRMKVGVVKIEVADEKEQRATSKGGLSVVHAVARHLRLWSDARRALPRRKDPTQGYETSTVVASLVYGLLSGGRGFSATEPMRGDTPLLTMLGLQRAPSAETVEEVVKYLGLECAGSEALSEVNEGFVRRCIAMSKQHDLRNCEGFVPLWVDGTLLEVYGNNFDSLKVIDGKRGQLCVGAFVGEWLVGIEFAGEGEGERTVGRGLVEQTMRDIVRPSKLSKHLLVLLDSLYGEDETLQMLERFSETIPSGKEKPGYIVGAQGLSEAQRVMHELPEAAWRDTGAQDTGRWSASGLAQAWLCCAPWKKKRLMICRRWKKHGEMIWNYAAVLTNLREEDPRITRVMERYDISYEEAIWFLYSKKQGIENQWKDLLSDMGLHHPPCAKACVNAVFYAIAGLAYNLSVAVRLLTLRGGSARMRLWRLRREVFDLPGYVVHHARYLVMRILDARDHLIEQLLSAMQRLARL
jgi:hypothetical protein